jgi:hypothetical protein
MSSYFGDPNPYATPGLAAPGPDVRQRVKGKVMAPAIALLVVGLLGLAFSLFNVGFALTQQPNNDPNVPELIRSLQEGAIGPLAAGIQGAFVLLNLLIVLGGIQMLRMRTWGFALAAAIMAMFDLTSGCCIIGLPVGIWSAIILSAPDVRAAFSIPHSYGG